MAFLRASLPLFELGSRRFSSSVVPLLRDQSVSRASATALRDPVKPSRGVTESILSRSAHARLAIETSPFAVRAHSTMPPKGYELLVIRKGDSIPADVHPVIADFIRAYNGEVIETTRKTEMVLVGCMDERLKIASNMLFKTFIVRLPGANAFGQEAGISVTLSKGVRVGMVLTHTDCAMSAPNRESYVAGLRQSSGWSDAEANAFFDAHVAPLAIGDPFVFADRQARHLQDYFKPKEGGQGCMFYAATVLTSELGRPIALVRAVA